MYTPVHFAENDEGAILALVRHTGFGHLVCHTDGRLDSIPLPFVVDDSLGSVRAHLARANPIWRAAPCPALLIVAVSDAYISPSWYPSKAEHGKVVPTWNYEVIHLHGQLTVRDEPSWLQTQIDELTDHNEAGRATPWSVHDAPSDFIAGQRRAIVGLELTVERVDAKRKLSQNRAVEDVAGVVDGLRASGSQSQLMADAVADAAATGNAG